MHSKLALFTWELREKAKRRRWFYARLERLLSELPHGSWRKLGGSVYVVEEKRSREFEELLKYFEGPDLAWYKLKVEMRDTSQLCTPLATG